MFALNLPAFETKIAQREGKNVIFDVLRRRYVALTPEELSLVMLLCISRMIN
jgi:hypothetical protein